MFPYRRQGPKKRKNGPPRNKMRGPQKGAPNSARDLLPMLQPATKALAQMLAGRTQPSGQLGQAQAMLAHAERLIGERAHNRLNPAEREEFLEQLARLRLTLADAAAEAEVQEAEDRVVKPPVRQVARERLKEMALSLSQPERTAGPLSPTGANGGTAPPDRASAPAAEPEAGGSPAEQGAGESPDEQRERAPAEPAPVEPGRSGRLQLPRASAEAAASAVAWGGASGGARRRGRRVPAETRAPAEGEPNSGAESEPAEGEPNRGAEREPAHAAVDRATDQDRVAAEEAEKKIGRRTRKPKRKGLPEGWVIDDEGFVVPGPS